MFRRCHICRVENVSGVEDKLATNSRSDSARMVLVECDGIRHLAKEDRFGKWRTLSRHRELKGTIEIIKAITILDLVSDLRPREDSPDSKS